MLALIPFISKKIPLPSKYRWIGPMPALALWQRIPRNIFDKIDKNSRLQLVTYEIIAGLARAGMPGLSEINNRIYRVGLWSQLITQNTEIENNLLKKSLLNYFPHEVYQIKIETSVGKSFTSKARHGKERRVAEPGELAEIIDKMNFNIRKNGLSIKKVEIIHTHPSLEMIVFQDHSTKLLLNGLSKSDIEITGEISQFLDCPLGIKAVSSSGLSYSISFYD